MGEPFGTLILAVAVTVIVNVETLGMGRTTLLQGGVRLAVFFGFVFLALSP